MPIDPLAIAILLGSFAVLVLLRIPVALALALAAIFEALYIGLPLTTVGQRMVAGLDTFALLAIPFFILGGEIMGAGGISRRLIALAGLLVGWVRGGLGMVNIGASTFFGALSGSSVADVSAIGSVTIPMMKKRGYDTDYAVAVTVSGATQAVMIPPSHNLIIYSMAAGGVSIGALFTAGILPGILLGGILTGVFTATESAAIACLYAFILTFFVYRDLPLKAMVPILQSSLRTLGVVLFIIAAAGAFGYFLAFLQVPALATDALLGISDNVVVVLLLVNLLLLVLGAIMDMAPLIVIMTPILLPVATGIGMDPVQFGIMLVFNLAIGLITPPVGNVLFVGCAIGRTSIEKVIKTVGLFLIPMLIVLLLITYVPFFSLAIPGVLGQ